jgi:diguanylate cyclase (GGDEF)-like protein/PAS domain S-box-containing protein
LVSISGFDARERPWYINAEKKGQCVWNDVYILATGQDMALAASCPVYNHQNSFIGVVSLDIFLSHLDNFLNNMQISNSGQSFIIDRTGLLIATSSNEEIIETKDNQLHKRRAAIESNIPIIRETALYLNEIYGDFSNITQEANGYFKVEGEKQLYQIIPIKDDFGIDWVVVVVIPEDDFLAPIAANKKLTITLIILSIIITLLTSRYTANKIIHPVEELKQFAQAFTQGELNHQPPEKSKIREFNDLIFAYEKMGVQLKEMFDNLTTEIGERKQIERSLRNSEERYRSVIEDLPILICSFRPNGEITFVNSEYCNYFQKPPDELIDHVYISMIHEEDRQHVLSEIFSLSKDNPVGVLEQRVFTPNGEMRWQRWTNRALFDDNHQITGYQSYGEDITLSKKADDTLKHLATHDLLTQLPNRNLFDDRLNHAIDLANRNQKRVGILFLDLDGFKAVNDAFGHKKGDQLLQIITKRILSCVRKSDTVARLGGDEFAIILEGIPEKQDITPITQKIISSIAEPFTFQDAEVFITGSIGISIFPDDGKNADTLLQNADHAMYIAKSSGKNTFQFFSPELKTQSLERLELGNHLRNAIAQEEFSIYYQPQINSQTGDIFGLEALLRWNSPELGWISPGKFIPLAEETGLIIPLTEWVLNSACQQTKAWHDKGFSNIRLSVNLSSRDLKRKDLAKLIRDTLVKTQLPPESLELELTENIVFQDMETARVLLDEIKQLGVRLAVDDFGTGYSTLSQLAHFPFDTLKIDQRFAPHTTSSSNDAAIVKGIITIARNLGLSIVAEGVESNEELTFFNQNECYQIQGWIFHKALPTESIDLLLSQKER